MKIGMLWFDNDPKTSLQEKVGKAVDYYNKTYGKVATTCFVHPSMLHLNDPKTIGGVELRTSRRILPNHFWIGVE